MFVFTYWTVQFQSHFVPMQSILANAYHLLHLIGKLRLVDFVTSSSGCITARLLVGSRSTLLAHFHLPIMAELLGACLSALGSTCATKCHPKFIPLNITSKEVPMHLIKVRNRQQYSIPRSVFSHLSTNQKGILRSIPHIPETYIHCSLQHWESRTTHIYTHHPNHLNYTFKSSNHNVHSECRIWESTNKLG